MIAVRVSGERAKLKLGLLGARGRMGTWVRDLAAGEYADRVELVAAVDADDALGPLLASEAVIDFSLPEALSALADAALASPAQLPVFILGSTGGGADLQAKLDRLAEKTPVLVSTNFSTGVMALVEILRQAAPGLLGLGYSPVLTETHHIHKKDAPSGTALTLAEAIQPGGATAIEIHSIRRGEVIGDHEIEFRGPAERLTLAHFAEDRSIFARGALDVALWLARRGGPPGRLQMRDYFASLAAHRSV